MEIQMGILEVWEISREYTCVYTEEKSVAQELRKEFGRGTRYFHRGSEIGWHFVVPKRIVPLLERRYEKADIVEDQESERSGIGFQEFAATVESGFDSRATFVPRAARECLL